MRQPTEIERQIPRKRRRAAKSCQECRRCKTKCSRVEPCSHCVLLKTPCIYSNYPAESITGTLPNIRDQFPGEITTSRRCRVDFVATPNHQTEAIYDEECPLSSVSSAVEKDKELIRLRTRIQTLEGLLSKSTSVQRVGIPLTPFSSAIGTDDASPLLRDVSLVLNKSRLFGRSHWSNSAALEFQRIAAILNEESTELVENDGLNSAVSGIGALLRRCKFLAKARKAAKPEIFHSMPNLKTHISKTFADHSLQLYVSHFESAFRILHIPSFWAEYEHYWEHPAETVSALQFKIQLVVAIGLCLQGRSERDDSASVFHSTACQWIRDAHEWLFAPAEKDRLRIDGLQIACLLVLACQTLDFGGDIVYVTMGNVVRMALQMGLHRDPKHFSKMTPFQGEIRKRLWVTILELNLQASLDAGAPLDLSIEDFDTDTPLNINDIDMNHGISFLSQHSKEAVTDSSLQRALSKTLKFRYNVVRRMNGLCSSKSYNEIREVTSILNNACRDYGTFVVADTRGAAFRANLADLLLRRFLLHLHRPLAGRARTDPSFYFSRKIALDAAMALLSPGQDKAFSNLLNTGGGMFKNRMIHVSTALAAELLREVEEFGHTSEPKGYRKLVADAVREALRQIEERIRLAETNADVKMHMKLSMTLCQAEGRSGGVASLQDIARAAIGSLELSCAILQARTVSQTENESNMILEDDQWHDNHFLDTSFEFDDIFGTLDFPMDGTIASETTSV